MWFVVIIARQSTEEYVYISKTLFSSKFLKILKTINLKFFGPNDYVLPGAQEESPVLLSAHYITLQAQPIRICLTTFTIVYQ